jgi:eukaryotic-like serine/threonine-protein kinase
LWARTYPRDDVPPTNLAVLYSILGEFDKGLVAARDSLKVSPDGISYDVLCHAYVQLNRLDEAKAIAQEAQAHNSDAPFLHNDVYAIAFLQHDTEGMSREAAYLASKSGYEDASLATQSDTAAYFGQLAKARELTARSVDSAVRADAKERAGLNLAVSAVRENYVGNPAIAKRKAHDALALSDGRAVESIAAIALALSGEAQESARLSEDISKRFPEDTLVQFEFVPMIRASTFLVADKGGQAVEALATASRYELGGIGSNLNLYPAYLRGLAHLRLKQGRAATVEFQKIIDDPGAVVNSPIGALAHLGLGRAYAMAGDNTKSRAAYQDFLALWKDADPDVPILQQAKSEYAALPK